LSNPYDVSHIYDETGSAKARHHEVLRGAQARHLAASLRRSDDGWLARILSSPGKGTANHDERSLIIRSAQAAKTYWWVPAGMAFLVLLRSVIGG
jgi:hypothetical protein